MHPTTIFVRIIFPQAMRVIIPPVGNEVISMVKNTSLVSVIALAELLYTAQLIYSRTYETIPLLIVASLWYLIIVSILSAGQHFLERHYHHHT
jgi:polar amino acid transport system permease protein